MKRISKVSLFLILLAMIAAYVPVAFADEPGDCPPADTFAPASVEPCLPEEEPPTEPDPCDTSFTCPPTEPDPCETSFSCPPTEPDPCEYGFACDPCGMTVTDCPVEPPVVTVTQPVTQTDTQEGVSFNDSDLGVSLYVGQDETGAPMLEVYETQNQTTTGNFALTVTQTELADTIAGLTGENVLLKSAGHVRIFVLTTGEVAIFVGPDSEGKVHVKVFDGIPWSKVYGFTIDPV